MRIENTIKYSFLVVLTLLRYVKTSKISVTLYFEVVSMRNKFSNVYFGFN